MKSFATKVIKLSQDVTSFGGISYVNAEFINSGLGQLIDTELGSRGIGAKYTHSEIFSAWFNVFFCGGECAEDIQDHLRKTLEQIPGNAVPGPDILLCEIKSLAVANTHSRQVKAVSLINQ